MTPALNALKKFLHPRPTNRFLFSYFPVSATVMKNVKNNSPVLGVIYGNRDFFPDVLVTEARADIEKVFSRLGIKAIQLSKRDSKLGGVETHADARKCAAHFRKHVEEMDGVLVCLPNFGDEKGVAETLKMAELNVPVLIQGYPDDLKRLDVARRRDAYCGKISVCNNLVQAGVKFSLTSKHVSHPGSEEFLGDLQNFLGVCRVVNGVRGVRLGAVGARPGAFNTVRYSKKFSNGTASASRRLTCRNFWRKPGNWMRRPPPLKINCQKSKVTPRRQACQRRRFCRWQNLG